MAGARRVLERRARHHLSALPDNIGERAASGCVSLLSSDYIGSSEALTLILTLTLHPHPPTPSLTAHPIRTPILTVTVTLNLTPSSSISLVPSASEGGGG